MSGHGLEIIKDYEVLFAARTGLTILIPKSPTFDCGVEVPVEFKISPDGARDILVTAAGKTSIIKDLRKEHLDEALRRGVIMFYELKDDEVVRCTPCNLKN